MKLKLILVTFTLVAVGIALIVYRNTGTADGLEVKVLTPEKGVITSSIRAPGKVVTRQNSEIVSMVNSRVVEVLVKEGQLVSQGELLVLLDDREALATVNSDKAELSEARAKSRQAERKLKAYQEVFRVGGMAGNTVQEAELDLVVAKAAEQKAAADLRISTVILDRFKLVAPYSGLIVKKKVEVGDAAVPGVSLLSLADISQTEVEVAVDESDAGSLRIGQEVEISSEAMPNKSWSHKIVRIETAINKDETANILKVYVEFGDDRAALRLGQQVDAKIKLAEKKDVYRVPFDAVISRDGKNYLAMIRDGKVHFEPVVTGIEDLTAVEILPPLPSKEVILSQGKQLQEGQVVHLAGTAQK